MSELRECPKNETRDKVYFLLPVKVVIEDPNSNTITEFLASSLQYGKKKKAVYDRRTPLSDSTTFYKFSDISNEETILKG